MYTNINLEVIQDNAHYTDSEGVKYPRNFPKDEIGELHKVTEAARPVNTETEITTGFIIDETYTQIWQTRPKTAEEITQEESALWDNEMALTDNEMPRVIEDIIDTMSATQLGKLASQTKAKFDAKKAKRQEGKNKGYIE